MVDEKLNVLKMRPIDEYTGIVSYCVHWGRIRCLDLQRKKTIEAGPRLVAVVMALRALLEGSQETAGSTMVVKGEIESWQKAYLEWFDEGPNEIPRKLSEEVKIATLAEFSKLLAISLHMPESMWQSDRAMALRVLGDDFKHHYD